MMSQHTDTTGILRWELEQHDIRRYVVVMRQASTDPDSRFLMVWGVVGQKPTDSKTGSESQSQKWVQVMDASEFHRVVGGLTHAEGGVPDEVRTEVAALTAWLR